MCRGRSARALNFVKPLAGERLLGVKQACAGDNIWGGFFDANEQARRDGSQGSRKARGGVLERTLGRGGRAVRLRRATESPPVLVVRSGAVTTLITDKV